MAPKKVTNKSKDNVVAVVLNDSGTSYTKLTVENGKVKEVGRIVLKKKKEEF